LKDVKNVHALGKPYSVYGSICVTPIISDDLQDASAETLEGLGAFVFSADLSKIKGVAYFVLHVLRAGAKRPQRVAEPNHWLR
jgi:hypothetical protein